MLPPAFGVPLAPPPLAVAAGEPDPPQAARPITAAAAVIAATARPATLRFPMMLLQPSGQTAPSSAGVTRRQAGVT
jgi:hypothetical protein